MLLLFALTLVPIQANAAPTSAGQAAAVVNKWVLMEKTPLGSLSGKSVLRTETHYKDGVPMYYVVYLNPKGFVVVPADDLVEPIIAFFPSATKYDPSDKNPAGALIQGDLPARVLSARLTATSMLNSHSKEQGARKKWQALQSLNPINKDITALEGISDVRVSPLVKTAWNQEKESSGTNNCYNYYTPKNYVCGCVATAMAQLMKYHEHPKTGVGNASFNIKVGSSPDVAALRGGNGSGGPYNWDKMLLSPDADATNEQLQAIGALTYDAGVASNMMYDTVGNGGSGAYTRNAVNALTSVFSYTNAIYANYYANSKWNSIPTANLSDMINPNLDAGYPVYLGIIGSGGHAILSDGYGYNSGSMYHHLNMGWGGYDDLWYNLPDISGNYAEYNSVYECVYNVFPSGGGEVISGRAATVDGTPIVSAEVTLSGGANLVTSTDARGIYSFVHVPSSGTYTVKIAKSKYEFTESQRSVVTGRSTANSITVGNKWGIDFKGAALHTITASAGANGRINPSGEVGVRHGLNKTFTITANAGCQIDAVSVDGIAIGALGSYTFENVSSDHTIEAAFKSADVSADFTIKASAGAGGSITPSGIVLVSRDAEQAFVISADENKRIDDVKVDGKSVGVRTSYKFTNVNADHVIAATFVDSTAPVRQHTIMASAGANGSIDPSGVVSVDHCASRDFIITPASGYQISDVKVDGTSVGAISSYKFIDVTANHAIEAAFSKVTIQPQPNPGGGKTPSAPPTPVSVEQLPETPSSDIPVTPAPTPAPDGTASDKPADWRVTVGAADADGNAPVTIETRLSLDSDIKALGVDTSGFVGDVKAEVFLNGASVPVDPIARSARGAKNVYTLKLSGKIKAAGGIESAVVRSIRYKVADDDKVYVVTLPGGGVALQNMTGAPSAQTKSSGGGCDAGFGVMALFAAAVFLRRKSA